MIKKGLKKVTFVLFIIFLTALASASVRVGPSSIIDHYSPNSFINGWINISFNNTSINSKFISHTQSFTGEISLLDLLEQNELSEADYSCIPTDCGNDYAGSR